MVPITFLILRIVSLFAAANDLLFHKIPHSLTYHDTIVGVVCFTPLKGLEGSLLCVSGIAIGRVVSIIPVLTGGTGADHVKLPGAVGEL